MYMCVHIYTYIYIYIYIHIKLYIYIYIYTHRHVLLSAKRQLREDMTVDLAEAEVEEPAEGEGA